MTSHEHRIPRVFTKADWGERTPEVAPLGRTTWETALPVGAWPTVPLQRACPVRVAGTASRWRSRVPCRSESGAQVSASPLPWRRC